MQAKRNNRKFKVGDRVRIVNAAMDSDKIGQIRVITGINGSFIYLEGCRASWKLDNDETCPYLELIENDKIKIKIKIPSEIREI